MDKKDVKKMIIENFEEELRKAIKHFENVKDKRNGNNRIYNHYYEVSERMYGYVVGVIDLYYTLTETLRCDASNEFYPIYNEYREKLWKECNKYMELDKVTV